MDRFAKQRICESYSSVKIVNRQKVNELFYPPILLMELHSQKNGFLMLHPLRRRGSAVVAHAALYLAFCAASSPIHAVGLNDTGQTLCFDAGGGGVPCSSTAGGESSNTPRQDARYGRDAAAAALQLVKVGAGNAGFDYTKIANDGSTLPATAALGSLAADWACTKDNVTGLTWEVKTTSGLRSETYKYLWYSTDATRNGGSPGVAAKAGMADSCGGTQGVAVPSGNPCNTKNFAIAVNAANLCGKNDWRMPTQPELLSLVHLGKSDHITFDATYFPTLTNYVFLSDSTAAENVTAVWVVETYRGVTGLVSKASAGTLSSVRLVRTGP